MTTVPTPDPGSPASPVDLAQLVDDLEERGAVEVAHERSDDVPAGGDQGTVQQQDLTADVPGAPEPPD